jgi:hypothetical protein
MAGAHGRAGDAEGTDIVELPGKSDEVSRDARLGSRLRTHRGP